MFKVWCMQVWWLVTFTCSSISYWEGESSNLFLALVVPALSNYWKKLGSIICILYPKNMSHATFQMVFYPIFVVLFVCQKFSEPGKSWACILPTLWLCRHLLFYLFIFRLFSFKYFFLTPISCFLFKQEQRQRQDIQLKRHVVALALLT